MWFLNSRMTLKDSAETTGGAYGLFESLIPPGFSPPGIEALGTIGARYGDEVVGPPLTRAAFA